MLTSIIVLSTVTVGAVLVTGSRVLGLRRIVKHSTKADVAVTVGTGFLLGGTITGLAVAITAGLMFALVMSVLKLAYAAKDRATSLVTDIVGDQPVYDDNGVDQHGNWMYNQAPYLREGELA
jgi:hypothetical protein